MITGTVRAKGLTPPRGMARYEGEKKADKNQSESDPFDLRGVIYEEDPVKLQEIMDRTDREREALHKRLNGRL